MKNTALILVFLSIPMLTGCKKAPILKAAKATKTHVETTITTTSSGTVDAEQQAALGFTAAGRVSKILVRVGDHVRPGQVLATLDNEDLKSLYENAIADFGRSKELFQSGLVSRAALDEARKNKDVAKANLDKTIIAAPFDGVITEQNLELGGMVPNTAKTPIRIIDMKPRIIKGDIDEVDLAKVKVGDIARVRIQAVSQQPFHAFIRRVVPYVSTSKESDRTSQIELQIKDAKTLIPVGASADVEIVVATKDNALALPARTVLGAGDQRYVFLFEDGKVKKAPIKTGVGNYERVEIASGVNEGQAALYPSDEVELKDGARVKAEIISWP